MELSLAYQVMHGILAFFILLLLLRATFMDPGFYGKGNTYEWHFVCWSNVLLEETDMYVREAIFFDASLI